MPIFIRIVNVFDLHFQGQRRESSTLGSSYVIIPQTEADRTNIAIANTESHVTVSVAFLHLILAMLKVKVTAIHISNVNILQMVTDRANVAIANK